MFTEKIFIRLSLICLFVLFVSPSFLYADGESFWLFTNHYLASNGGVSFGFYPSGYSDGWYWGVSDSHLHWPSDYHETLSGDWAAAIYFSGIQNNKGMWLTQHFNWPNWDPVTDFNSGSYNEWNDPCNPIDNIDTARSMVETNQIRVTIDYNLVDLGEEGYSPLSFIDANGNSAYVQSERYVLIQTYTIKNVRTDHNTIQDLRFFQFLHSHPTGTYYPAQFSSYSTANYPDALKGYDPQHPDLNFRYDISQWRSGDPETEHVDWIGFSSTIEPDHFDNGFYNEANGVDQYGEPVTGTHIRIENKSLNDEPNISAYDAAGAMEWDLGNLEWNTEKKVTVAVMFGSIPSNMPLRVHNINKKRDYYTISGAIEDANNNDVLVADPSVYYETANFGSKVLTLKSSNPADPCIVASTIISGDGYNGIVTFTDNNSTINGFTITSGDYGVSCSGSSCGPTIANCLIRNNTYAGVDCWTSAVPTITNCIIRDNYTGIECYYDGQAKILNNLIVNNNYGIVVEYTDNQLTIRNNTISRNDHGIYRSDETAEPDISNCIIWNNGTSPNYNNLEGTFDNVNYCCINETRSGTGNITADPCFVAPDANDFHLKNISPCIDKGDPNFNSSTEKDIDGEDRIMDGDNNGTFRVDIGADEFCPYDLSQDGFVDFSDFAVFARSWKTSDGNTNYNYLCDYFPDSKIDYKDLYIFCNISDLRCQ
ncbi:MAG: right-handed parallel beta-helix repeat-containing protein [Phycisphaerae bacterium]|nr:right-handed parallel beta-helix repeat-containing protein [Phycisphaerae bacterium]